MNIEDNALLLVKNALKPVMQITNPLNKRKTKKVLILQPEPF